MIQRVLNKWVTIGLCVFFAGMSMAQDLKPGHPTEYIVQKGDTLWDISSHFLADPWRWPEIWNLNQQIANPHLIYPGDVLSLVFVDGKPQIVLDRGVVKLSPEIRITRHEDAIASIPLNAIREFFSQTRVVTKEQLKTAPYMVAGPESRILVAAGDTLYARGKVPAGINVFQIFREGQVYRDPETREVLGIRAQAMGSARYQSTAREISRFGVIESFSEIGLGDKFLPLAQDQLDPQIFPEIPDHPVIGEIIAVEGGVSQIGTLDVVAMNRGTEHGLDVGHLLAIMEAGEVVRDRVEGGSVKLPDEQAGLMMIFKTYDKMSFGLTLEADKPLAVGHRVTNFFSLSDYEQRQLQLEMEKKDRKRNGILNRLRGLFDPD